VIGALGFKFIKMKIHALETTKLSLQITHFTISWENQNPVRPLSQASASNHSNVFTFTLPLTEGRAGEATEPSNKMSLFLSASK
jgi:hypothetical protein